MPLSHPIFQHISEVVDRLGVEAYVVGGYVRDHYLGRPSTDIDVVVVGSGVAVAEELGRVFPSILQRSSLHTWILPRWKQGSVAHKPAIPQPHASRSKQ